MSFPRHPKYKDSGVEWLGEVPEHWEVRPNKALMTLQKREVGSAWSDTELLSLTLRGVVLRDIDSGDGKYPADFSTYQMVEPQDLVFCLFDMDETPRTVGVSRHHGMITAAYDVFRCKEDAVPSFVYYFYIHIDAHKRLRPFYTGLRKTVRTPTFLSIKIPFPPNSEQQVIAAFLDRETAKIDGLIAEQQRLIELLQEKRQAVISHAVTKGLNPDAPMKDSGIEWLGEVPEHWDVVRLGHRGRLQNGLSIGGEAFGAGDPFVSYGDVYNNATVPDVPSGLVRSSAQDQNKCGLEAGDVLFTRTSETVDDIGVASTCLRALPRSTFAGFLIRFRPYEGVLDSEYSTYLFRNQGVQGHFAGTMNLVTRASLSQGELRNLPSCVPPLAEQRDIAAALNETTRILRGLVAEAKHAVILLQERRSALISAAVTGQIDVRGFAGSEAA
jgi:type I restriction enzyme S subunit